MKPQSSNPCLNFPWKFEQVRFSHTVEYKRTKKRKLHVQDMTSCARKHELTCSWTGLSVYASIISISFSEDRFSISLIRCFCFFFFISLVATCEKMQKAHYKITSNLYSSYFSNQGKYHSLAKIDPKALSDHLYFQSQLDCSSKSHFTMY